MGDQSAIEWTEATWNPIVGCSRVSEGCRHCYAERQAFRAEAMGIPQYVGTTKKVGSEIHWTGKVALVPSALDLPLRWRRARQIFVNSMSDLFHERVPVDWIERIFEVMRLAPQHTFQVLTKRPGKMHRLLSGQWPHDMRDGDAAAASRLLRMQPLPNVWLGVSIEDQATADSRIPLLLQTPAALRWVSYEPALGPVDFDGDPYSGPGWLRGWHTEPEHWRGCDGSCSAGRCPEPVQVENEHRIDWIVVGGESGPGARPFDVAWARQTIAQGRAAGVPVFVKQLGAHPHNEASSGRMFCWAPHGLNGCGAGSWSRSLVRKDRKGGDMNEWPADLRVRQYPGAP